MAYIRKISSKNKKGYTYSYTIDLGPDPRTGKRRQKTKRGFSTKKEAEQAASKVEYQLSIGTYVREKNILFKDFAEEWLNEYGRVKKISTVRPRRIQVNRLLRYFANIELRKITKFHYQNMLNDLKERGYAFPTIEGTHSAGRMIFQRAMEKDYLQSNPTEYATIPKDPKTVEELESDDIPKYLEKEELAVFLDTAKTQGLPYDNLFFPLLSYSGIRVGELLGLKWADINFEDCTIRISKTLYNPGNNISFQLLPPKNGKKRTIEIDPNLLETFKSFKRKQAEFIMKYRNEYHDEDFIFVRIKKHLGYPEASKTVERRMARLLRLSKLNEYLTPHSLRHTHVSLLAEAGVSLDEIMERLGHSDDKTTRKVYLHVTKSRKKEASQKFSKLMRSIQVP